MDVDVFTHPAIQHTVPIYHFSLNFQRITWIPLSSGEACYLKPQQGSGQLKITVLYGTEQHEIGMFQVLHDECIIEQQLSCRLQCSKPGDLGKLHVYVDEVCCSGLAGHIAVDLKEFFYERDCEVHLEYPMHTADTYGFRAANFKMTIQCDHLREEQSSSNLDLETIIKWSPKQSSSPCLDEDGYTSATETEGVKSLQMHTVDCIGEQTVAVCEQGSDEVQLLKDVESILCELNAKLTSVVAPYALDDNPLDSLPLQVKDSESEYTWPRPSFVPTLKWDSCSQPKDEPCVDCGPPCGGQMDVMKAYQGEIVNHVQAGNCTDCFLCSMRSSDKYEALFSCFSSSNEGTETSLTTGCESSDESSCPVEDDSCRESARNCAPRRSSAIFHTIFRVVLIAGAAVLGLKGVSFVKRKGRRRGSGGTAPHFQTGMNGKDQQKTHT